MKAALIRFCILNFLVIASRAGALTDPTKQCPTNKIAPHRRISSSGNRVQHRTFALFNPNRGQTQNPPLREPQTDDLDDCGDIENYDENDLSSLISPVKRQENPGRLFFNAFQNQLQQAQQRPPNHNRPQSNYQQQHFLYGQGESQQPGQVPQGPRPQYPSSQGLHGPRPQYPSLGPHGSRPQYSSAGPQDSRPHPPRPYPPPRPTKYPPPRPQFALGDNHRRPPEQHFSNNVKPVYEGNPYFDEQPTTYRPHVVGGPVGHVVGHTRPTSTTTRPTANYDYKVQANNPPYFNSFSRPNYPRRYIYSQSILGSFVDLLFR